MGMLRLLVDGNGAKQEKRVQGAGNWGKKLHCQLRGQEQQKKQWRGARWRVTDQVVHAARRV